MSEPARFLISLGQALATMSLYKEGHPARERAVDSAFEALLALCKVDRWPRFSFLGVEVVYGQHGLRELKEWEWGTRLANVGIQRIEIADAVTRIDFGEFLEEVLERLGPGGTDTALARQIVKKSGIKYGAIGVRGTGSETVPTEMPVATIDYGLGEEIEAVKWLHEEVENRARLPMLEAEAVVRSLSVAMHGESQMVMPLLQLKDFDQYTTTHSTNVSVLSMALAESLGLGTVDVRAFGVAGLLHDLGKVRIPREILVKTGRLSDTERDIMRRHPVDGAKIIVEREKKLDLAAVVAYEHHIMLNGMGYPQMKFSRPCHYGSRLVHICDVFDALCTKRPYREAWDTEKTLKYLEELGGTEFDPELVIAFVTMMRQWDQRRFAMEPPAATIAPPASPIPAPPAPAASTPSPPLT